MFLLPSILVGLGLALFLGGRPSRLLELELRHGWTVFLALAVQVVIGPAKLVPSDLVEPLHIVSYGLLAVFAAANLRTLPLVPILVGMSLNAVAITANGGSMPVSAAAAETAGVTPAGNVGTDADTLAFLGDVFAIPASLPLANVFSIGDVLIALGTIGLILWVSLAGGTEPALDPRRLARPFAAASFRQLVAGKLVSHLGDWLTVAALVGWVYGESGSTAQVALLLLVRLAPPIVGGGVAAALVDRLPKGRLLVWIEVVRGCAVGGALVAVAFEVLPLAVAALAVSGGLAAVSGATVSAVVPSLLDEERLPAGNAALGIAQDVAMAVGALAAGIALSTYGAIPALLLDLGTFAVAAALFWRIRAVPGEVQRGEGGLLGGLRYLARQRTLMFVLVGFGAATLATGLTNASLPRFLDDEAGLGPGAYGFGLSALAWGLVAGQAVVGFARVEHGGTRWMGTAFAVMGGLFVVLALNHHAATALLLLALIGLVDGVTDVLFDTIVQREADPSFYGRVFGFASAFMTTTMMGAVAAAPLLNHVAEPHDIVLLAGSFVFAASAVVLVACLRAPRASVLPTRVGSP